MAGKTVEERREECPLKRDERKDEKEKERYQNIEIERVFGKGLTKDLSMR